MQNRRMWAIVVTGVPRPVCVCVGHINFVNPAKWINQSKFRLRCGLKAAQ